MKNPVYTCDVSAAAAYLREGKLIAYPTETFFALGCAVCDAQAVSLVYQAKCRAVYKPLPVIACDTAQIDGIARMTSEAEDLCACFWPGPLTVLLPARGTVPDAVTGGTGKVAVRVSPHGVARELARQLGQPVVASSANVSGRPPVTDAYTLDAALLPALAAVVTQGPRPGGGLPSTLVEALGDHRLRVLREGAVDVPMLETAGYNVCA